MWKRVMNPSPARWVLRLPELEHPSVEQVEPHLEDLELPGSDGRDGRHEQACHQGVAVRQCRQARVQGQDGRSPL